MINSATSNIYSSYRFSEYSFLLLLFVFFKAQSQFNQNSSFSGFDQLIELEDSLQESGNIYELKKVLDFHIGMAKSQQDTLELISTYDWRFQFENIDNALLYADSALFLAEYINNSSAKSHLYYSVGSFLYDNNYPEKALEWFISGYNVNDSLNSLIGVVDNLNLIASIKREYGQKYQALQIQKESYKLINKKAIRKNNTETLIHTLEALSKCYLAVMEVDSAITVANKGKKLAAEIGDSRMVNSFEIIIGQSFFYKGNYRLAEKKLLNIIDYTRNESRADILYYLGQMEIHKGNKDITLSYYSQIDSILGIKRFPVIDNIESVYQVLLANAIADVNKEEEEYYLSRLIYYDSLKKITDLKVEQIAINEFVLNSSSGQTSKSKLLLFLVLFGSLISSVILLLRRNSTVSQKKKSFNRTPRNETPRLANEVVSNILKSLKIWEKNMGYLDPNTTQVELASLLGTNSTYLSRTINEELGKSYSEYLRGLRVEYMLRDFDVNYIDLSRKSMIQLAEKYGFRSQYAFISAFKSRTGITPSLYLRNKRYSK